MAGDLENEVAAVTDGRTARRERGKVAVLEAILEHIAETNGYGEATPEEVAQRAGVSVASLFRYFGTLDAMRHAASAHWLQKNEHLLTIDDIGEGSLPVRIETFVRCRIARFEAAKAIGRLVRRLAHENEDAHDMVQQTRAMSMDQVRHHFDTELSQLDPLQAKHLSSIIGTVTSHESLVQLTEQDGMNLSEAATPLEMALTCLLTKAVELKL